MTKIQTSNSADLRNLDDSEIDHIAGGVIDGCIRPQTINTTFTPFPPSTPWFSPTWTRVGETGTL